MEQANSTAASEASVIRGAGSAEQASATGVYQAECLRPIRSVLDAYLAVRRAIEALQSRAFLAIDEWAELLRLQGQMRDFATVHWKAEAPNVVCHEGKIVMLDGMASTYTVVGPYLGLISSVSWSAVAATDVMAQIAGTNGWREAGTTNAPQWTNPASGARASTSWSAASGTPPTKALSSNAAFSISTSGTVKGCFLVIGTGASATNLNTSGKLWSAGAFTGGDKTVANLDTLNVSYSTGLG